ncbi:DUF2809 domain-containing protein [Clostridium sp. A1-XYC3]|uniref:DUF2809 domain-containing protein n=1 Tax=Clostridium tanneri TaxID=3037988 RepID=A0ABU4JR06_9CLOT|nr:DUF2809 domain-containing protein [Clostridium sp. A1-XYC3]MDW8800414.1 DUF2809 domain-containing protein [Clostridium sp. A1-XYC3]
MIYKRNRVLYGFMTMVVVFLGLYSRRMKSFIPEFLNIYLGDILWALVIFIAFAFILRAKTTKTVAVMAISFCYLIELSQLYHANWIDNIRKTTLGGLVLGYGFLWSDLIAYAVGVGIGMIIELVYLAMVRGVTR